MKKMRFEAILDTKVLTKNVNVKFLEPWINGRVTQLLGIEDDILQDYVINSITDEKEPSAKKMQLYLTGFLGAKNARIFMKELWEHLVRFHPACLLLRRR